MDDYAGNDAAGFIANVTDSKRQNEQRDVRRTLSNV